MKRRGVHLAQLSGQLARQLGDPYLIGISTGSHGLGEYHNERWQLGLTLIDRGDQILRERCTGAAFEMASFHTFSLWSLLHLGEMAELSRRCPALIRDARERGDLYAFTNLLTFTPFVRLMVDDPAGARQDIQQALTQWTRQGYHIQHYALLQAQAAVELYTGNGVAAWEHVSAQWPLFSGSFLKRVQVFQVQVTQLHAYSAPAAAATVREPRPFLRVAEDLARRLRREKTAWSAATALYVRGAASSIRGDRTGALTLLGEAVARFEAAGMRLHVAALRRRLGELGGGAEGRALVADADTWMAGQNIQNPARMAAVYAPGFPLKA